MAPACLARIAGTPGELFESLESRVLLSATDNLPTIADLEVSTDPVIVLETTLGDIYLEMFVQDAPGTVSNFADYMTRGLYSESFFHRSDPGFVLQGGGFAFDDQDGLSSVFAEDLGPITNEFGRSNIERTVAMAKFGGQPDSATSQFFFNLADNSSILDDDPFQPDSVDSGGFTVFAKVITDASWAVVQSIVGLNLEDARFNAELQGQVTSREGEPLFRDAQGFQTLVDTGTPYTASSAMGELPVTGSYAGTFNEASQVELLNAQFVKPAGTTAFFDQVVAYPEGFAGPRITESLELVNPNSQQAAVQVIARYESGLRDEVIYSGFLDGNASAMVQIHDYTNPDETLVRTGVPYALEVYTAAEQLEAVDGLGNPSPIAASLNHTDFGGVIGESFTNYSDSDFRSQSWDFPVMGDGPDDLSFLLWQNMGDTDGTVTVDLYEDSIGTVTKTFMLEAYRRGGLRVFDGVPELANLPDGALIAARVSSDVDIVAALSAYQLDPSANPPAQDSPVDNRGSDDRSAFGMLGVPGESREGALAGMVIPANGVGLIAALNASTSAGAVISLQARLDGGGVILRTPTDFIMTSESRAVIDLAAEFPSIPTDTPFTLTYSSTQPVSLAAVADYDAEPSVMGGQAAAFSNLTSSVVHFADGLTADDGSGGTAGERISVFNPFSLDSLDFVIDFHFSDGSVVSTSAQTIGPLGRVEVLTEDISALATKVASDPAYTHYGITVRGLEAGTTTPMQVVALYSRTDQRSLSGPHSVFATGPLISGDILMLTDPAFDGNPV